MRSQPIIKHLVLFFLLHILIAGCFSVYAQSWIRINQLGYTCQGVKVAVWASKEKGIPGAFQLKDSATGNTVYTGKAGQAYRAYGPFAQTMRLAFTAFTRPGKYYLQCGVTKSPVFVIGNDVYHGAADFTLQYMRQQRSGYNPFLQDSCHTGDGYTMYGPMPDTTHIDVAGGWHDATDYLQYTTTSATATYHLLAASRDFPGVFADTHAANGLDGSNGVADVLDEARWGLEWLLKMHPRKDWLFTQLADDRDHAGFRLPNHDSVDYGIGKGKGRPVYFANGLPQGLGKYKNQTTGVASAAGKFSSAFALGAMVYANKDKQLSELLANRSGSAYQLGLAKPGVAQTAPNREAYYYEEGNWADDMELAAANLYQLTKDNQYISQSVSYSVQEKVTPWMGADTAKHYQWYPFHNFGHYELAKSTDAPNKALLISYYKEGIDRVWKKAKQNAFFRGVPFIWCSNNLTVSFTIQCYLYRVLSGDKQYAELEQAGFDWLFGCNPWGKSMVYGLPAYGNTPLHPHSSLSLLKHYDLNGGLVDGPVYGSIYKNLRGLQLYNPDVYADFQSDLVVYHDDAGDYSTNEPTMDGTASLVYLLAQKEFQAKQAIDKNAAVVDHGAIIRGSATHKKLALVFTGDEFTDGGYFIVKALKGAQVPASFFLTGNFYRNKSFAPIIKKLQKDGHYLGAHSDKHLLYCDWEKRDSLLVTKQQFTDDLEAVYKELGKIGIDYKKAHYFLPPYEWYNDSIATWTKQQGLQLVSFTPGTRSNADYTYPEMGSKYVDSKTILQSILNYEQQYANGLNGFILLVHIGTDPRRTDKFYALLPLLIDALKKKGYQFSKVDAL
ncbi:MAG: glycoside hydrolase family 9 protein [Chitinophagaceae bacterium]